MSNPYFQFKQFTVRHDKCAMKVGTDGVLLGAWAPVQNAKYILDVGAGSGLISLQLAQRNPWASITSIEIDPAAAAQAKENIQSSPWSDRMEVICSDFRDYHAENKFDLIVSNPPYFVDALKCPDNQRCMARHTNELNYELLFGHSTHLLSEQGIISVIIPSEVEKTVIDTRIVPLGAMYPSPGFLTEVTYLFAALDLTEGEMQPDEDRRCSGQPGTEPW